MRLERATDAFWDDSERFGAMWLRRGSYTRTDMECALKRYSVFVADFKEATAKKPSLGFKNLSSHHNLVSE